MSARISHEKSVIDYLVIAGGTGYRRWCGRLEGSPSCRQQITYQRRDDIYPEAGTGRLALGEQLYADKIINRPRVFQWLLRIEPDLSHFKAGTYRFTPQMTVREMLKLLESGKEARFLCDW